MNFEMREIPREHADRVRDQRIERVVELVSPAEILEDLPLGPQREDAVLGHRAEVKAILDRDDDRLLVVVGPCSVHDPDAATEYAQRLAERASDLRDDLCVAMRVYFEKPRTTTGWKGLINDPHLDGSHDMATGLRLARKLLLDLAEGGLPAATEMLDPITPQYLADLVTWTGIGARTSESQTHREMASGLSMPVGFKNSTDGSIAPAVNAMSAALQPHRFLGIEGEGQASIVS